MALRESLTQVEKNEERDVKLNCLISRGRKDILNSLKKEFDLNDGQMLNLCISLASNHLHNMKEHYKDLWEGE